MSSIYVYGISILVSFCIGQLVGFSARPWPMPCASTRPLQNSIWATTRMVTRASRHREWPRDWEFLRALDLQLCSMRFCFDFKKGAHTFLPTIKCAWWKNRGAIATWTQQVETLANTNLWQQPKHWWWMITHPFSSVLPASAYTDRLLQLPLKSTRLSNRLVCQMPTLMMKDDRCSCGICGSWCWCYRVVLF